MDKYKLDTLCVQAGYSPKTGQSRIPPIVQSTTFVYEKTQDMADLFDLKSDGYFYTRLANPTVAAFENKVAALEGGVCGIGCASGMSATSLAVFTVAGAGDNGARLIAALIYAGADFLLADDKGASHYLTSFPAKSMTTRLASSMVGKVIKKSSMKWHSYSTPA